MINIRVNAAYCLFDGFAGRPLQNGEVTLTLDGVPYRPVYKNGGWFVITDQPEGAHTVELSAAKYQPERFEESFSAKGHIERSIIMKPSAKYPFGGAKVSALRLETDAELWCAAEDARLSLKLAQSQAKAGDVKLTLYYADAVYSRLLLSGDFMLVDGDKSEICSFESLESGAGTLASGLKNAHSRGVMLYQAARFTAGQGDMTARFCGDCKKAFTLEQTKKGVKLNEFGF